MHRLQSVFFLLLACAMALGAPARAAEPWERLPATPTLPKPDRTGMAPVNGIRLWYATYGHGDPVILVHGGLANSSYWGWQIPVLAQHYQVIVLDSRGHGRSTRTDVPIGYDLMASDVLGLMDYLHIGKAALVGWSDGAIIGVKDVDKSPVFIAYEDRASHEYATLSPTPGQFKAFLDNISKMWASEPHFTASELRGIRTPTWIVDADRDEAIKRENTDYMASLIPGAGELILPRVSHFAFLQDPALFNEALLRFLAGP
jgi:pimeloyl-ACP methyl ester carboxylesterase